MKINMHARTYISHNVFGGLVLVDIRMILCEVLVLFRGVVAIAN